MSIGLGSKSGKLQGTAVIRDKDGNVKGEVSFESDNEVTQEEFKKITETLLKEENNDD